jgi:hypothetical protein
MNIFCRMFYRIRHKKSRTAGKVLHHKLGFEFVTKISPPYEDPRNYADPMEGYKQQKTDMKSER